MWKHKTKWLVRGGRKVRCYLCGKKILAKGDLFLFHQDTGYYSHQSCLVESTTISGNERRKAVKKIAVGAAVVGAIAAGAGKLIDISSQSKGSNSPAAQTILTSQGLIPPALTSDPSNPVPGQMWYRSDAGVMAHFDGVQNRVVYSSEINDGNVHVTSKGIVNGLSVLPNDGTGWFGPDTTKGATATGQYGSPYTEATGIQEAINYVSINQAKIIMTNGVFNVTAPFTAYPSGNSYGQILLPYNPSPNTTPPTPNPIFIEIEGFGGIYGDVSGSGTSNGLPVPTGGTVIFFQPPSAPPTTTIGQYSGIDGGDQSATPNYVILKMSKVTLRQNPNPTFANMQLSAIANVDLDQIRNDIYFSINTTTSTDLPPISPYSTGIGIIYLDNGGINNRAWGSFRNISSVGYFYGNMIQPSTNVFYSNIYALYCEAGLNIYPAYQTGRQIEIYGLATQSCPYGILFGPIGSNDITAYDYNLTIHNWVNLRSSNYVADIDAYDDTMTGFITIETQNDEPDAVVTTSAASNIYVTVIRIGGPHITTTAGPTAGTVTEIREKLSNYYIKYVFIFNGYENDTTTNQTIGFPNNFTALASITSNTTGLTLTATTSGITITAPDSTTTYSGIVIVEGY